MRMSLDWHISTNYTKNTWKEKTITKQNLTAAYYSLSWYCTQQRNASAESYVFVHEKGKW